MAEREDVPTIILCGGRGTRISEVNPQLPKPMLPLGERPLLWHIMKTYAAHGHRDFVLALGWLGDEIRRFFLDAHALDADVPVDPGDPEPVEHLQAVGSPAGAWRVTCLDTGLDSLTGTRVRLASQSLGDGSIMVTYGDGIANVDITGLLAFHRDHGRLATVTAVRPPGRFGELVLAPDGRVERFAEKPPGRPINGGFMVFEREAIDAFIPADEDVALEREPMAALAAAGQLVAFEHGAFWQPVDTATELQQLERLWAAGSAPWTTAW